ACVAIKVLPEDAIVAATSEPSAVAHSQRGALLVASPGLQVQALRIAGTPGGDVDDPIDGIGSPLRSTGPADDLDALDILHDVILQIPLHAREQRGIDAARVTEHQQLL